MDGPFHGREGEVKHLYRGTAFIYNRKHMENGGIFVAKECVFEFFVYKKSSDKVLEKYF